MDRTNPFTRLPAAHPLVNRGFPTIARRRMVAALATAFAAQFALAAAPAPTALPTGGQVVAGQASIQQAGAAMTIRQATDQAILNWQSFNIGASASVNFIQPGASSVALNRVLGTDPSAIYGQLTANGQVFLVNPSGVLFGPGARVDVGGLVASTLAIRDADFLDRNYRFTRDGATAAVVNQGEIVGQYVALLAPEVRNDGVIAARMGTVALAAGDAVTLGISGQRLVDVQVDKASLDTLVENRHLIRAEEGMVVLSAQSAHTLLGRVVNSGAVEANGISTDGGTIRLLASSTVDHSGSIAADGAASASGGSAILLADLANPASRTTVSGSITARGGSASGDGGFIETSASRLNILDSVRVNTSALNGRTGRWLLDPHDFTIATVGGDTTGATITGNLATTDVVIESASGSVDGGPAGGGDINVNDAITWSSHTLTLTAARDIKINAVMTASGTANLSLNAATPNGAGPEVDAGGAGTIKVGMGLDGFRGRVDFSGTGALEIDGNPYTVISDKAGLQNMNLDLTGFYALGESFTSVGAFTPVGDSAVAAFTGTFEGLGNVITGLSVSGAANGTGLFGASGGDIRNVGLKNTSIASDPVAPDVGGLVGFNSGRVRNSFVTGAVSAPASSNVGGLVGRNLGEVTNSYSTADVTGLNSVGGLVGKNDYIVAPGPDVPNPDCFFDPFCAPPLLPGPDITTAGPITYSYASGKVTGTNHVGGLVGANQSTVFFSYASGEIAASAGTNIGGLVGNNSNATDANAANIDASYSTGKVNSGTAANVGGLVGNNDNGGTASVVTRSFWDTTTSTQTTGIGAASVAGAVGMSTANLKAQANFTSATAANGIADPAWNFADVWAMYEGNTYPLLQTFMTPVTVSVDNVIRLYGNANPAFTFNYTDSTGATGTTAPATHLQGTAGVTGAPAVTANVGIYPITPSGLYSDQQGYRITAAIGNTVTINPRPVNLTAPNATKIYDGATTYMATVGDLAVLSAMLGVGADTVTGITLAYADAAAGAGNKMLTPSLATVSSAAGNYDITYVASNTASITPKPLTADTAGVANTKVYDGNTTAAGAALLASEAVGAGNTADGKPYTGDTVNLTGNGSFDFKDAGVATKITFGGLGLGGAQAGNYLLTPAADINGASITKLALAITDPVVANKTFDGATTATVTDPGVLSGFVGIETVTRAVNTANFDTAVVGAGKNVTVNYTLGNGTNGGLAANYSLADKVVMADITAAAPPPAPAPVPDVPETTTTVAVETVVTKTEEVDDRFQKDVCAVTSLGEVCGQVISIAAPTTALSSRPPVPTISIAVAPAGPVAANAVTADYTQNALGAYPVRVPSTDSSGRSILTARPDVVGTTVSSGQSFNFTLPDDTFTHTNPNAVVSLSARQANGQPLPSWMRFDPQSGSISGTPPAGIQGNISIQVQARDRQGNEVSTILKLNIGQGSAADTRSQGVGA